MHSKLILIILFLFITNCSDDSKRNLHQQEMEKSKAAATAIETATKLVDNNDPSGLLKLYEISKDNDTYTVEYSEVAAQELILLLHSKTEFWIKTFSKIDKIGFFNYLDHGGIALTILPNNVTSEEDFERAILENLRKLKVNDSEMALVNHLTQIFENLVKE